MHSIYSLVQRYALSRAGSTIIGLFVVISLVWFAGPTLGLSSVSYRLVIIGAIILIALMVWLVRRIVISRRGAKLQDELSGSEESKAATRKLEIQLLKEKMNEAISSLKSSELGARYRGNAALYALPWYMIIGPSAAGKSSLLRQSGLHFPYASDEDINIKGYGGTRNCDWWFSDQAVFLDTAGRYTTEDDDRDEWISFLRMLRKHRKKMPVNGVLVAVSLAELLTTDNEGLEWHVKIIRHRISEQIRELGMVFPVYLVFTKSDLLQGFEAFFEDLSEQERNQIWGAYLYDKQDSEDDVTGLFENHLNRLYVRLCNIRLRKVSMQRNLNRKAELFDFPSQFGAAAERINEFINLLFKQNPYQETPHFAGVYFTSATQEGTPIERVIGNLRQAFGVARQQTDGVAGGQRPFFIKDLFTDVIFRIQGGARANRRKLAWDRGLRMAVVITSLIVMAGTYLVLSGSYATNIYLLKHGAELAEDAAETIGNSDVAVKDQYEAIVKLQQQLEKLNSIDEELPWLKQVALYRANEQKESLSHLIDASLYQAYWVPVTQEVEHRLKRLGVRWSVSTDDVQEKLRPVYYETLKLYLQLTRHDHFDFDAVLSASANIWQRLVFAKNKTDDESINYVIKLSHNYLDSRKERQEMLLSANEELVAKARGQLYTKPDPKRLYALLLTKGEAKWQERGIKQLVTGGGKGYLTSKKRIQGIYTSEAWYAFVKQEISALAKSFAHGDWVLEESKKRNKADNAKPDMNSSVLGREADSVSLELTDQKLVNEKELSDERKYTESDTTALKGNELAAYLEHEIRALYFKDYAKSWQSFLKTLKYKLPRELADRSMALMYLSSDKGPIAQISMVIATNTQVYESRPEKVKETETTGSEQLPVVAHKLQKPVPELVGVFDDIQKFASPEADGHLSKSVKAYLEALSELYGEMDQLAASVDVKRDSERFAADLLSGRNTRPSISKAWVTTTTLVNSVKPSTRPILKSLLSPPISMAWSGVVGQATADLQQEWLTTVVNPYKKLIYGKFPFSSTGSDVALTDVAAFYHPNDGILWKFANERLSPYLHKTAHGWQPRKWLGIGANFSREFLDGLTEAQKITDALYTNQNDEPNMTFYLQPDPSTKLREMQIETNGQLFRYRNGPQVWQRFNWPGDMNQIGAKVMGVADHGHAVGELRADGPWGLFHLLTLANIEKISGTHYRTTWQLPASDGGTVSVSFKLRADRQNNIFNFKMLSSFKLPRSLFGTGGSQLAAY